MKNKCILFPVAVLLLLACTGCGQKAAPETLPDFDESLSAPSQSTALAVVPTETAVPVLPSPGDHPALGEGDGELLSYKNMQGIIYEVTSVDGCIFLPDTVDALGNGMTMSARACQDELDDPGNWPQVPIRYEPDCGFFSATIHFNYDKDCYEGEYADITPASFQRGSQLVVYGEYDGEGVLHAQRIYLIIWDR